MKELFDSNVGVAEWYDILNWDHLPDMGPCHDFAASGEHAEFMRRYVINDELRRFCGSLAEKLETDRARAPVIMIKGDPGVGKTTLLYALKSHLTDTPQLNKKYTFYAFQANRIASEDWKHEVFYNIRLAFKEQYYSCGQQDVYERICTNAGSSDKDLEEQIKKLKTYMVDAKHRNKFKKTMVFALDNVDSVTDNARVVDAFEMVNKLLEAVIIKKWFVVRPETFSKYTSKQQERIQSFNCATFQMPRVPLHEIVKHRVDQTTGTSGNKINPFSQELCDGVVLPFCKGSIRKGLNVVEATLRETAPKGFIGKKVSEQVIQNYLRKSVVPTLFNEDLVINLHDIKYSAKTLETPMAYDLLSLSRFSSDKKNLIAMLYGSIDRRNTQTSYAITGRDGQYTIFNQEFNKLLETLSEDGLVTYDKESSVVRITKFGSAHLEAATPRYYASLCKEKGEGSRSETYWRVSDIDISHQSIAKKFSTSPIF